MKLAFHCSGSWGDAVEVVDCDDARQAEAVRVKVYQINEKLTARYGPDADQWIEIEGVEERSANVFLFHGFSNSEE